MKTIIKLAIAALVIHACFRAGSVYVKHYNFKDAVKETAQFSGTKTDDVLHARVIELAKEYQIPLEPANVTVRRVDNHTQIDAIYNEKIEILPTYFYPWDFKVNVDAFTLIAKDATLPTTR